MVKNSVAAVAVAAAVGTFASGTAFGASVIPAEVLQNMAPQEQIAYIKALVNRQTANATTSASAALDTTPPVITKFNVAPKLNLQLAQPLFSADIKVTDDLSGVGSVTFYANGPSGQYIYGYLIAGYPSTNFSGLGGIFPLSNMLEPGVWTVNFAYAYDVAGNAAYFSNSGLSALGNTKFTVKNKAGYDHMPPFLISGEIQTASVKLSSVAKGTDSMAPFIGVSVTMQDVGGTAMAGVRSASASFCLVADPEACIAVSGITYATGLLSATLDLKGQVSAANGNIAGDYILKTVYVYDQVGNFTLMESNVFGGATDFSTYFPTTKIRVKP